MTYYAIYTRNDENTYSKSHMAFTADENSLSVQLDGNPYEAFRNMPEYIEA